LGNKLTLEEMRFPLRHPEFVMVNKVRVRRDFKNKTSLSSRIKSNIKSVVPKPLLENFIRPLMHVFSF
jgi:hypothetical protein